MAGSVPSLKDPVSASPPSSTMHALGCNNSLPENSVSEVKTRKRMFGGL